MKSLPHINKGFTLVELSIVLVIIGLLIGGILVGQSLIESAKITKTVKEFQSYNSAAMLFRDKFKCLPGDCNKYLGYETAGPFYYGSNEAYFATNNIGDGNGFLGSYASPVTYRNSDSAALSQEVTNFWWHMKQAGFISYKHKGQQSVYCGNAGWSTPAPSIVKQKANPYCGGSPVAGGWWIMGIDGYNNQDLPQTFSCKNVFGISMGNYAPPSTTGVITNQQAAAMDAKLDDGKPLTGSVTAVSTGFWVFYPRSPASATYAANCLNGNDYNMAYDGYNGSCGVVICSDF